MSGEGSNPPPRCQFGFVMGVSPCDQPGNESLRASWFYYPDPNWNVPLCAEHKSAVLAMRCERWLAFKPGRGQPDRSGNCGAPAVGLICWDCEGAHDDDCDEIGCPGYELMPACRWCVERPNDNEIDSLDEGDPECDHCKKPIEEPEDYIVKPLCDAYPSTFMHHVIGGNPVRYHVGCWKSDYVRKRVEADWQKHKRECELCTRRAEEDSENQ